MLTAEAADNSPEISLYETSSLMAVLSSEALRKSFTSCLLGSAIFRTWDSPNPSHNKALRRTTSVAVRFIERQQARYPLLVAEQARQKNMLLSYHCAHGNTVGQFLDPSYLTNYSARARQSWWPYLAAKATHPWGLTQPDPQLLLEKPKRSRTTPTMQCTRSSSHLCLRGPRLIKIDGFNQRLHQFLGSFGVT